MTRALRVLCLAGAPLLGLGCTGSIEVPNGTPPTGDPDKPDPTPDPTPEPMPPGPGALPDTKSVPGAAPVRRLTKVEFDNTLRDLLGVSPTVSKTLNLGQDSESGTAGFVKGGAITGADDARNLMAAATTITAAIKAGALLPCNPIPGGAAEQDACVSKFIAQFGKRAYRRPLTPAEADLAHTLYTTQRGAEVGASFEDAVAALVGAFLQTPQFLYHWELGPNAPQKDGSLIKYNGYEVASRLSYFFWATMPDDKLFAAADMNGLATPDQVAQQARRLLADDRAKQGLGEFHLQWMEIGPLTQAPKDESVKNFSPEIAQSMLNETRDFVTSVLLGDKAPGTLEALLTSPSTVIDASLAKIYGVTVSGAGAQPVALNPAQRAGLLTQLAFLTAKADTGDSHPVKRGDALLHRLLCVELQVPPNLQVPPVADAVPGGMTTRQRFEMHSMNPCATCHKLIDPPGFAFEAYDTVGAYRTTDQDKTIDTHGAMTLDSGVEVKFKDAPDLLKQLAKAPEAQACVAKQWMRYMLGRREVDGEAPSVKVAQEAFKKANFDLRELLVGLTKTRSFTHRSVSPGEVTQ